MPRTATTNERRATGEEKRLRVWRIARFSERFEMGEYERKGGLDYVRMYVTAATNRQSNESTQFLAQLEELGHYYPEDRDAFEGRFWRLCRLTATQEDWLRGYLLGPDREPIGDAKLAARLRLDRKAVKSTLAALKRVGLIEQVDCPDFSRAPDGPQEDAETPQEPQRKATAGKGRGARKPRKTSPAASIRDNSGKVRKSSELLYELTNDNPKENSIGQVANAQRNGDAAGDRPRQTQTQTNGQGPTQGQPPSAPTTAPSEPDSPQEVTTQGGRHLAPPGDGKPAITPPARVFGEPRIVSLGSLMPRAVASAAGYAVRAEEFADEIFALLRSPFDRDSREGQRERGNYRAALLDAIDAGVSAGDLAELMAKAKHDAGEIAKHRKRYYRNDGSPEQYWRFLFGKHMCARCGGKQTRAGPAVASG